jgi:hypothetical protein
VSAFHPLADYGGPGPEWYRELAEFLGAPWPRPPSMTRTARAYMTARAIERAPRTWPCPTCGGPRFLPDLKATLPYTKCGYAEVPPGGGWVHE